MDSDSTMSGDAPSGAFLRARLIATGLLLAMAILFLAALLGERRYPFLHWLRAFAEAAMVGALADWYAVTVLFKRPMGLPIPHTEIVPRNKDRIAVALGRLTQRNLITPEAIGRLVDAWRIPDELTAALVDPQRRAVLAQELSRLLARMLEASEDAAMQRVIRHLATKLLHGVTAAPLMGRLFSEFLDSPQRDRLIDDLLALAREYVERHRDSLGRTIADKLPWSHLLSLVRLDEKVANRFIDWLGSMLQDMRANYDDPMRRQLIGRLDHAAQWLMHSNQAARRETAIKDALLTHDALLEFIDGSWHQLKQWLLTDLGREASETRAYLDAALAGLGETLKTDEEFLALFRQGLESLVVELATRHRDRIGELVTKTVSEWPMAHMVDTIEREVGRDLQFIRINGALVGGLIGLLLHAVALLFDLHLAP